MIIANWVLREELVFTPRNSEHGLWWHWRGGATEAKITTMRLFVGNEGRLDEADVSVSCVMLSPELVFGKHNANAGDE